MSSMFGKGRICNIVSVPDRVQVECNIVMLGIPGAGKSALTVKFLTKRFISEYDPNLEDTYSSEEVVDQQPVLVNIMDTAEQLKAGPVNCDRYLTWASAFLVVYSIDDRHSFEGCQKYLDVVAEHGKGLQSETPIVLLGNKLDMERYRQVSRADGLALASRYGCLFFEVSACLDYDSVQHVFHEVIREARVARRVAEGSLFISEDRSPVGLGPTASAATGIRELPPSATAKLLTVKAQGKRRAATLTLLKGFKIF